MKTRSILAPIGTVYPHPANPRKDFGDLTELEQSIYEQGILQPPIALPADRVIAAWPQYADDLAGAEWVILMGHRRRAARFNVVGGVATADLEILVREDAIADDPLAQLDAMVAENLSRKAMEPLEESRAFADQVAAGRSQRTIAAKAGCSQGHVSKRLGLLKLPAAMLAAVESNGLSIKDALSYLDASDGDSFLMLTGYKLVQERRALNPVDAVNVVRRELDQRAKTTAAEKKLAAEGVKIIDPSKKFGNNSWQHELRGGDKAVAAAKKAGTLVAAVGYAGRTTYYSTVQPKKADNRTESDEVRLATERAQRKAKTGRDAACAKLVAAAPKIAESGPVGLLVGAVLARVGSDSAKLAMRWLAAAGTVTDAAGVSPYRLAGHILGKPWTVQTATAYAVALAQQEMSTRSSYHTWGPSDAAHLQLLATEVGYVPTEWEQANLDAITNPAAVSADTTYTLVWSTVDGWCLHVGDSLAPYDSAGADIGEDDFVSAQRWATESVEFLGHQVAIWTPGLDLHGQDGGFTAVLDDEGEDDEDEDDQEDGAEPGEYRLRFIDDVWVVMHGGEHLGDNDSIAVDEPDAACLWANDVVIDDCGQRPRLWQTRSAGVDFADAESGPGISIIA